MISISSFSMKFYRNLSGFETEHYYSDTVRYKTTCNHSEILALKKKVLDLQRGPHIHPSSDTSDSPAAFLIEDRLARILITERIVAEREKVRTQLVFCGSREAFLTLFENLSAWRTRHANDRAPCPFLLDGSWDHLTYPTGVGVEFSSEQDPAIHHDASVIFPKCFSYMKVEDAGENHFDPTAFREEVIENLFKSLISPHKK